MPDSLHGQSVSDNWACPRCGSPGYVVAGILRCGNAGCPNTHEYDPATGDRDFLRELTQASERLPGGYR